MRLKIGDDFLDGDNSVIAQTFAVNEIGDIQTQQGGFSNDFTIPLTAKNKSILGFPDNINSASRNPYEKVDATLYDNGVPIAEGYLRYTVVSDTELEASFFSDNVNWFNLLKGKLLSDLDLSEWDHNWDGDSIETSINADNTEGYLYPFINYGGWLFANTSGLPDYNTSATSNEDVRNLMPAMFVHTLIDRMFFEAGYKIQGGIVDHPLYKRMIIPFSAKEFIHSGQWVTDNTYTDTVNSTPVAFGTTILPWVTAGGTTITWPNDSCAAIVTFDFVASGTGPFTIRLDGGFSFSVQVSQSFNTPTGSESFTATFSYLISGFNGVPLSATAGNNYELIRVVAIAVSGSGQIESGTLTITPLQKVVLPNCELQMNVTLPKMKQTDLIKYVSNCFGGVFQTNVLSKTVTWSFFGDIKKNTPSALDWSDKLDMSKTREIDFTELLNNYGQESSYEYLTDSSDESLDAYNQANDVPFGDGVINIDNEHLPGIKTAYKAPFAATISELKQLFEATGWLEVNKPSLEVIAKIPFLEHSTVNFNGFLAVKQRFKPQPRIMIATQNVDIAGTIHPLSGGFRIRADNLTGTVAVAKTTSISVPFFVKGLYNISGIDDFPDTLAFGDVEILNFTDTPLIERFLTDQEAILNSMKYLSASLWLTEADIANLDFTIPIYLDRYKSYFYISKIEDFQGRERTTECELVKIS